MSKPPLNDALAALRANYAKKLPDKMAELDAAAAGLGGDDPISAVREIREQTHKLAGSAPSFGFPELGEAARGIERMCDAIFDSDNGLPDADLALLQEKLAALHGFSTAREPSAEKAPQITDSGLSGHVLVVEDEPTQALFVQVILKKAGFDVTIENDPLKVSDLLDRSVPDLIVLDMNMPGMDGDELAQRIRARTDQAAKRPILFLSGEEDGERQVAAALAGGNGFVPKPVNPKELVEVVERFLKMGSA